METVRGDRRRSPLARMGTSEDCATAAAYLVSDAAGWITGMALDVSAGSVMV